MIKLIILFPLLLAALLTACGGNSTPRTEETDREAEMLRREIAEKDSILSDVFTSLNRISENLFDIKAREGIVTSTLSGEIGRDQQLQINEDLTAINDLLIENRATIERLKNSTDRLRGANLRIQELDNLLANLTKQVQDKDADIEALKNELTRMEVEVIILTSAVDSLYRDNRELDRTNRDLQTAVDERTEALNTVYYIVGREKSLMDENILEKSGFIGRTAKVGLDYDMSKFTRVDRRSLDRIVVNQKRAKIVTSHPAGSYNLVMSDSNTLAEIVITDPDRFWETSSILVVSYK